MPKTLSVRFWDKVDTSAGMFDCWVWMGSRNPDGYGNISIQNKSKSAHRISWEIHNGRIPKGLHVLHRCDNPPCVNPSHLFLGTNADNVADMNAKGRQRPGLPRKLTPDQVREIRSSCLSPKELGRMYSVSVTLILRVLNRKTYKEVD